MMDDKNFADSIKNGIDRLKGDYRVLRDKPDEYVFSALCMKANLYKNPALSLREDDFEEMIVDGKSDGGVDILLTDPNSDEADMVIAQSKYYKSITYEDVLNAVVKMARFYRTMKEGHYEEVNSRVQRRFTSLNAELSEDAKIHFIFYTSAPQNKIVRKNIENKFMKEFSDWIGENQIELSLFFAKDVVEEIKESESRRPSVESGKIFIDQRGNVLYYGDDAVIVNVSAFSIKTLYSQHSVNLLASNLRYHVSGKAVDQGIERTIRETPDYFWLMNNGITIVCDDFAIDGREVKLKNFSIVNGGQTTYALNKSSLISEKQDVYLPCKIIKVIGETQDEKTSFNLEIAKATNTQKPIKPADLKANTPEQIRFAGEMRQKDVFYQTKRGEKVPKQYKEPYRNTSLLEVGKLCLAGVFQMPCKSRSKPSVMYEPQYYDVIFGGNQRCVAEICKELLYADTYFRKVFLKNFEQRNNNVVNSAGRISFARNARTLCLAFVALASRYYQGNITEQDIQLLSTAGNSEEGSDRKLREIFSNLEGIKVLIPAEIFREKELCDKVLDKLFSLVIENGVQIFSIKADGDSSLTAANYLKRDKNYYDILRLSWSKLSGEIKSIFDPIFSK